MDSKWASRAKSAAIISKIIFDIVCSAAIATATVFTYKLSSAVKDATVVQANSAHATARAYITLGGFIIHNIGTKQMYTDFTFKNIGQTLAFQIVIERKEQIIWKSETAERQFSIQPDFANGTFAQDIIAPSDTLMFQWLAPSKEFTNEEIKAVADGKAFYVVHMKMSYRDVFDSDHVSIICRIMDTNVDQNKMAHNQACSRAGYFT